MSENKFKVEGKDGNILISGKSGVGKTHIMKDIIVNEFNATDNKILVITHTESYGDVAEFLSGRYIEIYDTIKIELNNRLTCLSLVNNSSSTINDNLDNLQKTLDIVYLETPSQNITVFIDDYLFTPDKKQIEELLEFFERNDEVQFIINTQYFPFELKEYFFKMFQSILIMQQDEFMKYEFISHLGLQDEMYPNYGFGEGYLLTDGTGRNYRYTFIDTYRNLFLNA